jgi:DNA-binding IclR family transcriptional regulator
MISVGEIVTTGERGLKLALWPGSNATTNASSTGRATLSTVVDGVPYSLRLSLTGPTAITSATYGRLAAFEAHIEEVRADIAPYAEVETGIRFRLRAPAEVLPRWAEIRALLSQTTF